MTDLSPCPCCDGPAAFGNPPLGHQIYCLSMKCGTQSGIFPTKPMARNAWSKRASPAATPAALTDAIKVIRAEICPFKDGPMADGWAEAWGTFLNRLGDVDGTNELYAHSSPVSRPNQRQEGS